MALTDAPRVPRRSAEEDARAEGIAVQRHWQGAHHNGMGMGCPAAQSRETCLVAWPSGGRVTLRDAVLCGGALKVLSREHVADAATWEDAPANNLRPSRATMAGAPDWPNLPQARWAQSAWPAPGAFGLHAQRRAYEAHPAVPRLPAPGAQRGTRGQPQHGGASSRRVA